MKISKYFAIAMLFIALGVAGYKIADGLGNLNDQILTLHQELNEYKAKNNDLYFKIKKLEDRNLALNYELKKYKPKEKPAFSYKK